VRHTSPRSLVCTPPWGRSASPSSSLSFSDSFVTSSFDKLSALEAPPGASELTRACSAVSGSGNLARTRNICAPAFRSTVSYVSRRALGVRGHQSASKVRQRGTRRVLSDALLLIYLSSLRATPHSGFAERYHLHVLDLVPAALHIANGRRSVNTEHL
jgi:hypothetical protein